MPFRAGTPVVVMVQKAKWSDAVLDEGRLSQWRPSRPEQFSIASDGGHVTYNLALICSVTMTVREPTYLPLPGLTRGVKR